MRVAVVDIGTNSTRLLIADVDPQSGARRGARAPLAGHPPRRRRRRQRLALRGGHASACSPRSPSYRAAIDAHDCDANLAVLTSAVRDAANGAEFAARVRERLRARRPRPERRRRGAAHVPRRDVRPAADAAATEPTVVIDIGGGSTEFVVGVGRTRRLPRLAARRRRAHERAPHPLRPARARRAAGARARRPRDPARRPARRTSARRSSAGIAVAGTATSAASIDQELDPYDPDARARLPAAARHRRTAARPPRRDDRRRSAARSSGLHPDRAPTIVAGMILLSEAMRAFGLEQVEVSEHDILYGGALRLAGAAVSSTLRRGSTGAGRRPPGR